MELRTVTLLRSVCKDKLVSITYEHIAEIQKLSGNHSFMLRGLFPKTSSMGYNLFTKKPLGVVLEMQSHIFSNVVAIDVEKES